MATSDQTHDKPKQGQLDNWQGESDEGKNWLNILLVFLIVAVFAAFVLLVSTAP